MKRFGILIAALVVSLSAKVGIAQKQKNPDEQIIINKKFDETGNLIKYDSTYVHKWSSDSTFEFSFPEGDIPGKNEMPDLKHFFGDFFNDSVLNGMEFPHRFHFPPDFDDDYFGQFQPFFNDSLFSKYFGLNDPAFNNFPEDSLLNFPHGFGFTGPNEFGKQFEEHLNRWYGQNFKFHEFDSPQQQKEWNHLMEKHQEEIKEFRKKWNDEKPSQ